MEERPGIMLNLRLLGLPDGNQFKWYEQLLISVANRLAEAAQKVDALDFNKQEFLKTFVVFFQSIKVLSLGLKVESGGKETQLNALPAIMTLVRACLENYATFYFIYLENKEMDTIRFRFWSWWREGIMRRQKYKALDEQQKKQLQKESMEIAQIASDLRQNDNYNAFTEPQKRAYVAFGRWHYHSKSELLSLAGFSRAFADTIYSHLSSYSHTSSLSQLQTKQASYEIAEKITSTTLKVIFMIAGLYLSGYLELWPQLAAGIGENDREFYLSWCELAAEFSERY